jgi:16S rRNA (guanine1207-N2)-methyltransferase
MDTHCVALTMAERTLQANNVRIAQVYEGISVLPVQASAFDTVVIEMPKDRKLARRWLTEAFGAMSPGGQLYVAGSNEQGIRSIINDAEALFGNATVLGYKKGHRVARAMKHAEGSGVPSWLKEPGIAPGTWYEFGVHVRGNFFHLRSLPGVFAYDRLDEGTNLLLQQLNIAPSSRVLDVGCGYGIIGLLAARIGAAQVDLVDNNVLAVAAARENIAYNGITNAQAWLSDGVSAMGERRYNLVVTNPPFHVGKAQDFGIAQAFIEHARHALEPGGRFMLVANKFIRYDQVMQPLFTQVECLAETGRYHVLTAT